MLLAAARGQLGPEERRVLGNSQASGHVESDIYDGGSG